MILDDRRRHWIMTPREYRDAVSWGFALCRRCGHLVEEIDPDTADLLCWNCGRFSLCGIDRCVRLGLIVIEAGKPP